MQHDDRAQLARNILDLRRRRSQFLPEELFGEPAWGLLLLLFIADAESEHVSAKEICRRHGGSEASASRWLAVLESYKLVASNNARGHEQIVSLTPTGVHAVEACMTDARRTMRQSLSG